MPDDRIGTAPGAKPAGQIPVSPNNPCPFLRALVANGYVGGHVVPLSKLSEIVGDASGQTGFGKKKVRLATWLVAVIANGLGPLRVLKSATSGAVLDELRDGPLDKHGGGSRILDVDAKVHEDEIARLAGFGKDRKDPAGGIERGLTGEEIDTFMKANIKRDGDAARWYYPILMKGEWPVLLKILGKGEGSERYLSVAEVRTLFVERRLPERIPRGCRSAAAGVRASLEQRRARHEGVERGPELRAVAVLFLQDLVPGAGDHQMRAGAQMIGELLDRRGRDDGVVAGGQHQDRLADFGGIVAARKACIARNAVSAQATVGEPMPSVGSSSRIAALRA